MKFCKYHGLGNDYIVIDPKDCSPDQLTQTTVAAICDRHYGPGSDGILYGPVIKDNKLYLTIYNSDGSIAEKSGNGLRIFGQYLYDAGYVSDTIFKVETLAGTIPIELIDLDKKILKIHMGKFKPLSNEDCLFPAQKDPFEKHIEINDRHFKAMAVSVGNPHCVIFDGECSEQFAKHYGPHIENHPSFPKHINCQFVKIKDRNNIQIEIWERGSEYTLASGSSSTASACMAYHLGYCDSNITVHMPGGQLTIDIEDHNNIFLTGPVTKVYDGVFDTNFIDKN